MQLYFEENFDANQAKLWFQKNSLKWTIFICILYLIMIKIVTNLMKTRQAFKLQSTKRCEIVVLMKLVQRVCFLHLFFYYNFFIQGVSPKMCCVNDNPQSQLNNHYAYIRAQTKALIMTIRKIYITGLFMVNLL